MGPGQSATARRHQVDPAGMLCLSRHRHYHQHINGRLVITRVSATGRIARSSTGYSHVYSSRRILRGGLNRCGRFGVEGSTGVEDLACSALIKDITLDVKHNRPVRVRLVHDPPKMCLAVNAGTRSRSWNSRVLFYCRTDKLELRAAEVRDLVEHSSSTSSRTGRRAWPARVRARLCRHRGSPCVGF
jgi:hypothetical protein